jgi:hypothetical protein
LLPREASKDAKQRSLKADHATTETRLTRLRFSSLLELRTMAAAHAQWLCEDHAARIRMKRRLTPTSLSEHPRKVYKR